MPAVTPEDEFRMLYYAILVTEAKPRMEDLAVRMGLKTATATWRWNKLMKRLKEEDTEASQTPGTPKKNATKANGNNRKRSREAEVDDAEDDGPNTKKVETKTEDPKIKGEGDGTAGRDDNSAGFSSSDA